jgi:hypothetical protein
MTNVIEPADNGMTERIRAVAERDRAARRQAGPDPSVRRRWVQPWSLKERP